MRKVLLANIFLFCFQPIFGQSISKPQLEYSRHANLNRVTRFVIESKQFLWGITAAGDVVKWDLKGEKALLHPLQRLNRRATAILLDRQGNLILGFDDGSISVFDNEKQMLVPLPARGKGEIQFLFADASNDYWAVTPQGIFSPKGRVIYAPNGSSFAYNNDWPASSWESHCACLDGKDRLWVGFNKGEFGGDLYCFDTRQKVFAAYSFPVHDEETAQMGPSIQSIFCAERGSVLMTSGLCHYGAGPSFLHRFDGMEGHLVFDWKTKKMDEYVGPGSYNPETKKIYYYSERGFFRQKGVGEAIEGWEPVAEPELDWKWGKNQVGPAMNVIQFDFIGGEDFVFSSEGNGIGVCRNGRIRFLRQECIQSDAVKRLLPGEKLMMIVGFDYWEEFFISTWREEHYSILDDQGIKAFSLSKTLRGKFERINGVAVMPRDQIVSLFVRAFAPKKTIQPGKREILFKYDGHRFVQLKDSSFPTHSDGVEQWIQSDRISGGRFLVQGADSVVEYVEETPRTVFSGKTRWARYNNDGSILVCPEDQPGQDNEFVDTKLVLISREQKTELDLTSVNETWAEWAAVFDSSYAHFVAAQWKRLVNVMKSKLVHYQGVPLTVSGSEAYLWVNGSWVRQCDMEEWLGQDDRGELIVDHDVTFFDYFPELDMFLFQNDASLFVRAQGKTFDLGKSLDLVCNVTTARLWNGRLFLGTDGRGLVEFDSGELTRLIAQAPASDDVN